MSTIAYIHASVIPAAMLLLPKKMDTPPARVDLLATGLQESRFEDRLQREGGPAHGFWQFELNGGVNGVLRHRASQKIIRQVLEELQYIDNKLECYAAIVHNDVLACVFARLLLWTDPAPLPVQDAEASWALYLRTWRPGKPHPKFWAAHYEHASQLVEG